MKNQSVLYIAPQINGKYGKRTGVSRYCSFMTDVSDILNHTVSLYEVSRKPRNRSNQLLSILINALSILLRSKNYKTVVVLCETFLPASIFCIRKSVVILYHPVDTLEYGDQWKEIKVQDKAKYIFRWVANFLCKFCKKVIFISEFSKQSYIQKFGIKLDKCLVAYPPCEIEQFGEPILGKEELFRKFSLPVNEFSKCLLYVGLEVRRKNFMTLLKVLNALHLNQNKENKYILIKIGSEGCAEQGKLHRKYVESNNLPVHFIDYADEQDLVSFYHSCDMYVNPSLYEGFGCTPIEAQACGLPVISTQEGALKEVLKESAFIIKNPFAIEEYVTAIYKMMDLEVRKQYIKLGHENVERFSKRVQQEKWRQIFEQIIE